MKTKVTLRMLSLILLPDFNMMFTAEAMFKEITDMCMYECCGYDSEKCRTEFWESYQGDRNGDCKTWLMLNKARGLRSNQKEYEDG